ncbi:MAG: ornithine carbamoyltransferase [Methylococcales bacterium]|nr:ornithine carbamoyltransferase [Methylococcales bacterium]
MNTPRHFISLNDFTPEHLRALIDRAQQLKRERVPAHRPLHGKVLAMIFEKSSTRTRISFEAGMAQLGGHALFLSPRDTQLGRGEPLPDSARVISSMVDGIMLRTHSHDTVTTFAQHASVPVINGLTDFLHPCQLLADMQTYFELRGDIAGKTVAWIGDGNNMCHSYINAAAQFGFHLRIACPEGYAPDPHLVQNTQAALTFCEHPAQAAEHADLVVTDVWASMGHEQEQAARIQAFANYQVTPAVMAKARADALFMHCLPAHRNEEVSAEVIDGPQSVIFIEAENRLHAQKALLENLLTASH